VTSLGLTADEVLTTTRAVRRRLDLSRDVPRELVEECLSIALQAPTGSNRQLWHFVVVTDPATKAALADVYRRGIAHYAAQVGDQGRIDPVDPGRYAAATARVHDAADHLRAVLHEVPGMVIPCVQGRMEGRPALAWSSQLGSVIQAAWSFMLAARERGIGTCWTTVHLALEQEAAAILDIPYEEVTQVALIPFAFTVGTDFRPAAREPLERVLHWDRW
jgi:nitroreductase